MLVFTHFPSIQRVAWWRCIVLALAVSPAALSQIASPAARPASASSHPSAQAKRPQLLPIKSKADLERYLKSHNQQSPLNLLKPQSRQKFLNSLEFTESGVGGFSLEALKPLTPEARYSILALFGLENLDQVIHMPTETETKQECCQQASPKLKAIKAMPNSPQKQLAYKRYFEAKIKPLLAESQGVNISPEMLQQVLKEMAEDIDFYTQNEEITRAHGQLFQAAEKQGLARPADARSLYRNLLKARLFEEARQFREAHPELVREPLPKIVPLDKNAAGTHVYVPRPQEQESFLETTVDFSTGKKIVVLSHPFCHFCHYAARDIAREPELRRFMKEHSLWLSRPQEYFSWEEHVKWNTRFPDFPIAILKWDKDAAIFSPWSTPRFFFLEDGVVRDRIRGWPKGGEGRMDELKAKIRKHFGVQL